MSIISLNTFIWYYIVKNTILILYCKKYIKYNHYYNIITNYLSLFLIMKNIFNTNSRFSALISENNNKNGKSNKEQPREKKEPNKNQSKEKMDDKPKYNSFKKNDEKKEEFTTRNNFKNQNNSNKYVEQRLMEEKLKIENDKIKKEKEKMDALSENNFPELVLKIDKPDLIPEPIKNNNFIEKLKTQITEQPKNIIIKIPDGYTVITLDKKDNSIIQKYGKSIYDEDYYEYDYYNDSNINNDIIQGLVELYEIRTNEYINNWGEDEYDQTYQFQNYDCEYFDRLDHQYENEMEKLRQLQENIYDDYLEDEYQNY